MVVFAGGEATRLSRGLGQKVAKALLGMRSATVRKTYSLEDPTFFDWHVMQSLWASKVLGRSPLPLVFYSSEATHQALVDYLSTSGWDKHHPNIRIANIQRFAPVYDPETRQALPEELVKRIGLGHGEIFEVLGTRSLARGCNRRGRTSDDKQYRRRSQLLSSAFCLPS